MALFRIQSELVQKAYMKIEAHIKQHVMIGIWSLGYLRYVADNDDNPKCKWPPRNGWEVPHFPSPVDHGCEVTESL